MAFCQKCGEKLEDGINFCSACGASTTGEANTQDGRNSDYREQDVRGGQPWEREYRYDNRGPAGGYYRRPSRIRGLFQGKKLPISIMVILMILTVLYRNYQLTVCDTVFQEMGILQCLISDILSYMFYVIVCVAWVIIDGVEKLK